MKSWIYGIFVMMAVGAGMVTAEPAKVPVPVWDLAKDAFAATTGRVERVDGRVMMDGESAFAIPNSAITDPSCFTITMEIRFGTIEDGRTLRLLDQLVSDTGFAVDAFKWGVVTTVNGVTYEGNRFLATSDQVWKFVFAVRNGVVAEYQNNAAGPQYLLRISPNLAPIWVGRTPGRKGLKALLGYEILSLKVYGPDTKYYLPGESADTLKNGYIGGPGWLIRVPGKIDKPLPRILYYGDSISYGYGEHFSTLMKDKAYCYNWCHFVGGVGSFPTAAFEAAAAAAPFDIIIFNNGLHSLSWSPDKVTDAQIEAVLRNMVQAFRKGAPKAKLVWASTTPVTAKGSPVTGVGELNPIVIRINTLAQKVMKEEGVDSVDLYALLKDHLNLACGDTLHWSSEGYQLIAGALQKKCNELLSAPAAVPVPQTSDVRALAAKTCTAINNFGNDLNFLQQHTEAVVLRDKIGQAQVVVAPAWQGRVMTSTARGDTGDSFGWVNRELIASGKVQPHINVFGGEDRFWIGPEGGQFSVFFAKGVPFDLEHWFTPASLDSEPFQVVRQSADRVLCRRQIQLTNYSGTRFDLEVEREVSLVNPERALAGIGARKSDGVSMVAFESVNTIKNTGAAAWTKDTGLLSIWILGMFNASDESTVVIPVKPGPVAELGPAVNDTYFGKVPDGRLKVESDVLFFRGAANHRGKIGIPPRRVKPVLGSYDAAHHTLTLVTFTLPASPAKYVNSMWKLQEDPFSGDVVNSYSDDGKLGQFYELESSSPALSLEPGASATHRHQTIHLQGDEQALDVIAQAVLGVHLEAIQTAFKK